MSLSIGDIFRRYGDAFAATQSLGSQQRKVLLDLQRCRTPALGGHLERCEACGYCHLHLHSCRNRHCPTCQCLAQKVWLEQRTERLLPCPSFHVVFTLPQPLRKVSLHHRVALFCLLFEAARETLLTFGRDPKHLGAQLGITCVLHTWTRKLEFHPHLHCIVTAGGLSKDGTTWIPCKDPRFLFPVRALSQVFRGKFLDKLTLLFANGSLQSLTAADFAQLLTSLRAKDWVVYAKAPFGGAKALYSYLGRYTHRTGISNQRLLSVTDQAVVFRTKGHKTCSVAPHEFIRRFLLHVLPPHFVKIRHYGLLAPKNVHTRLEQARRLLTPAPAPAPQATGSAPAHTAVSSPESAADPSPAAVDPDRLCPHCRLGRMRPVASLQRVASALIFLFAALATLAADTS